MIVKLAYLAAIQLMSVKVMPCILNSPLVVTLSPKIQGYHTRSRDAGPHLFAGVCACVLSQDYAAYLQNVFVCLFNAVSVKPHDVGDRQLVNPLRQDCLRRDCSALWGMLYVICTALPHRSWEPRTLSHFVHGCGVNCQWYAALWANACRSSVAVLWMWHVFIEAQQVNSYK